MEKIVVTLTEQEIADINAANDLWAWHENGGVIPADRWNNLVTKGYVESNSFINDTQVWHVTKAGYDLLTRVILLWDEKTHARNIPRTS